MAPPTTTSPTAPSHDFNDGFPYKSHPLYKLRLLSVITALIGFVFNLFSIGTLDETYEMGPFMISLILLFISLVFVVVDLYKYAKAKISAALGQQGLAIVEPLPGRPASSHSLHIRASAESEYQWPSKVLLVFDVVLAITFQWLFWGEFFAIMSIYRRGYYGGGETVEAYANLCNFAASILHGIAFWKELMARKKEAWMKDLEANGWARCECGDHPILADARSNRDEILGASEGEAEPSKSSFLGNFGKGKVVLPKWAQGPNVRKEEVKEDEGEDEPLLVTPEESAAEAGPSGTSGYGTLDESVSSIPETIVKKKEKGKKRVVGAD